MLTNEVIQHEKEVCYQVRRVIPEDSDLQYCVVTSPTDRRENPWNKAASAHVYAGFKSKVSDFWSFE